MIEKSKQREQLYENLEILFPTITADSQNESLKDLFIPLKNKLFEIDACEQVLAKSTKDKITKLLSRIIHYCHREEVVNLISLAICKFKGQLKGIYVDQPPVISLWQSVSYKFLKHQFCSLPLEKQNIINHNLDQIYLKEGMIPHIVWFLKLQPQVFIRYCELENELEIQEAIEYTEKLFIGIIAVSNFGCVYMWNRLVKKFLNAGGEITWIKQGLKGAPEKFKYIAWLSQIIAYSPECLISQLIFQKIGNKFQKSYLTEAMLLICYYQSLACYTQAHGIKPEESVDQSILGFNELHIPSKISFQNIYKKQSKRFQSEIRKGEEVRENYQIPEEQQQDNNEESFQDLEFVKKLSPMQTLETGYQSAESVRSVSFQELAKKSNASVTFAKIKKVFGKFAFFTIQKTDQQEIQKLVQFYEIQKDNGNHKEKLHERICKKSEVQVIHATEWNFQHTLSFLNDEFSENSKLGTAFKNFFDSIETISDISNPSRFTKKKCKDIQYYYEFLCYYIHLHVYYKKLVFYYEIFRQWSNQQRTKNFLQNLQQSHHIQQVAQVLIFLSNMNTIQITKKSMWAIFHQLHQLQQCQKCVCQQTYAQKATPNFVTDKL